VLEVLYHRAMFGGARISPAAGVSKNVEFLRPTYVIRQAIIFLPCGFFFFYLSSFFLAYSQLSQIGCLPHFHTWWCLSANLGCRSETCCTRLAQNTRSRKSPKIRHLGTMAQFCQVISLQLRNVLTIGKKTC